MRCYENLWLIAQPPPSTSYTIILTIYYQANLSVADTHDHPNFTVPRYATRCQSVSPSLLLYRFTALTERRRSHLNSSREQKMIYALSNKYGYVLDLNRPRMRHESAWYLCREVPSICSSRIILIRRLVANIINYCT